MRNVDTTAIQTSAIILTGCLCLVYALIVLLFGGYLKKVTKNTG